jgi:predicted PurR-regulated permease PerM
MGQQRTPGQVAVGYLRGAVAIAALVLVGLSLYGLRGVLTPVFFAFLIAYALDPLVDRLEARRVPRGASIAILVTGVLVGLALVALLVVPGMVRDVAAFADEVPSMVERAWERLRPWLAAHDVSIPRDFNALVERVGDAGSLAKSAAQPAAAVLEWLVGSTASAIGAVFGLLMVPVFASYLLYDFDRMIGGIRDLIPERVRPRVVQLAGEVDEILGQFVRGQVLVMVALAVLYAVGYGLVSVPLAVPIGLVAGLLSFIPYVGGAVALGLALIACVLDWSGPWQLVWVVVVYTIIQTLEGFVITPRVVGDKVGLPAVWVLFALMLGGELFGFMGVLLALPAAAVAKIFVRHGLDWYRHSEIYRAGPGAAAAVVPEGEGTARPGGES